MARLSMETLGRSGLAPGYDRAAVTPGIVHLGLGNFHRAHQAHYVDGLLARDPRWGILGVSLRRPDMADALTPQDGLYTLGVKDGDGTRPRVIGAVLEALCPGARTPALIARMADPGIRLVTLTVTEKGYCHDPSTGRLDPARDDIRADLGAAAPRTMPGILVAALAARRAAGVAPFTVLSCDNLPGNGHMLRGIACDMAAAQDDALAAWIEAEVAFPASMVDRITPATTEADRAEMAALTGLEDAWPVVTEPFSQWVIEDAFSGARPDFDGVDWVSDVAPWEAMKLRMLNGTHSTLAYFGQLLGHETVADAIGDAALERLVAGLWQEEIAPTLSVPGADLPGYARALAARYANPALRHRTAQIAGDGSQKVRQRLLDTIRDRRAAGQGHARLTLAVAAWVAFVATRRGAVDDPMAARFADPVARLPDAAAFAGGMLDLRAVFGDLSQDAAFRAAVTADVATILHDGPRAALAAVA